MGAVEEGLAFIGQAVSDPAVGGRYSFPGVQEEAEDIPDGTWVVFLDGGGRGRDNSLFDSCQGGYGGRVAAEGGGPLLVPGLGMEEPSWGKDPFPAEPSDFVAQREDLRHPDLEDLPETPILSTSSGSGEVMSLLKFLQYLWVYGGVPNTAAWAVLRSGLIWLAVFDLISWRYFFLREICWIVVLLSNVCI